jgi:hypothetical protein
MGTIPLRGNVFNRLDTLKCTVAPKTEDMFVLSRIAHPTLLYKAKILILLEPRLAVTCDVSNRIAKVDHKRRAADALECH